MLTLYRRARGQNLACKGAEFSGCDVTLSSQCFGGEIVQPMTGVISAGSHSKYVGLLYTVCALWIQVSLCITCIRILHNTVKTYTVESQLIPPKGS